MVITSVQNVSMVLAWPNDEQRSYTPYNVNIILTHPVEGFGEDPIMLAGNTSRLCSCNHLVD